MPGLDSRETEVGFFCNIQGRTSVRVMVSNTLLHLMVLHCVTLKHLSQAKSDIKAFPIKHSRHLLKEICFECREREL